MLCRAAGRLDSPPPTHPDYLASDAPIASITIFSMSVYHPGVNPDSGGAGDRLAACYRPRAAISAPASRSVKRTMAEWSESPSPSLISATSACCTRLV